MYDMIFLIGVMRSGTTFFRNILSANKNILAFPGELSDFWTNHGGASCGNSPSCPALNASDLKEETRLMVNKYFDKKHTKRNSVFNIIYRVYRKIRYHNESILKGKKPFYLLNKSTHMMNKIDYLNAIFPDSKIIFILRDMYSNVNSLKKHLNRISKDKKVIIEYPKTPGECWRFYSHSVKKTSSYQPTKYCYQDIPRYWIEQNAFALKALDSIQRKRCFLTTFSQLVNDTGTVINQVSDFLGLQSSNKNISMKLINNLTNAPLDKWRDDLSKEEITIIDGMIESNKSEYDYILSRFNCSE